MRCEGKMINDINLILLICFYKRNHMYIILKILYLKIQAIMKYFWIFITVICMVLGICQSFILSVYYCGFSGHFCGVSNTNDVTISANLIILAFANFESDGTVTVDNDNFPFGLVDNWQRAGKKVIISMGGQHGKWQNMLNSSVSITKFIQTLVNHIQHYNLDGVDLDIEEYTVPPLIVANTIIDLKKALNSIGKKKRILVVTPEDVTVYQGSPVPDQNQGGVYFNYFVPIINLADQYIDFYQPQAYNNWYGGFEGGSFQYLLNVYLNWRNLQGLESNKSPIQNFKGVQASKLILGILGSQNAGNPTFYHAPKIILQFKRHIKRQKLSLRGFMIWNSYQDKSNLYAISRAALSLK